MATSSTAKLYAEGKGFGLPHTDVEALAVECALRAADADFTFARPNSAFSGAALPCVHVTMKTARTASAPAKEEDVSTRGVAEAFALLARNGKDLDSGLSNDQRVFSKAAALAFSHQIRPAFDFVTMGLEQHYAVRAANRSDPNSILAYGLNAVGYERSAALRAIKAQYRIDTLAGALMLAAGGLKAFEDILRVAEGAAGGLRGGAFAFGTAKPTTLDCLAFAACSGLLYAEFSEQYGEVRSWQAEQRAELPRLMALTEAVRLAIFASTNNHFFSLKPILPSADSSAYDAEKPYREGRLRFLTLTAAFAGLYFLVTNAATLVQVLEAMDGGDDDEDDDE